MNANVEPSTVLRGMLLILSNCAGIFQTGDCKHDKLFYISEQWILVGTNKHLVIEATILRRNFISSPNYLV
jgi:hypothetical protein